MGPATYTLHGDRRLVSTMCMRVDGGIFACSNEGAGASERYMRKFSVGEFQSEYVA